MDPFGDSLAKYAAFFGREPDYVLKVPSEERATVWVARFPPKKVGFLKRMFTQLPDGVVWITCGMSLRPISTPSDSEQEWEDRVELSAYHEGDGIFVGAEGQDLVAQTLALLAELAFESDTFLGVGRSVQFPEPLVAGGDMNGLCFSPLDCDMPRLCKCTPGAKIVLSAMPITSKEMAYIEAKGDFMALVDLFEEHHVPPHFDPHRPSVV